LHRVYKCFYQFWCVQLLISSYSQPVSTVIQEKVIWKWLYRKITVPLWLPLLLSHWLLVTRSKGFFWLHISRNSFVFKNLIFMFVIIIMNSKKIGKMYSLEYTDIPKAFFMPYHTGCCFTNAIQGHCYVLGYSWTNAIVVQHWDPRQPLDPIVAQWVPTVVPPVPLLWKMQQADMDESIRCSLLMLECEEHLNRHIWYSFMIYYLKREK
jgi:hypothetical protein